MGKPELLRQLRELTGSMTNTEKEFWASPGFESGVAKGIVAELLGNARTEWLVNFFIANPEPYILWIERESQVLPSALIQRGIKHNRIKFLVSDGDLHVPLRIALESRYYPFVVAPNRMTDVTAFQRIHLLAEKSKSTVFLLGDKKFSQAWPISLQLEITNSEDGHQVEVHRQKHGQFV